MELKVSFQRTAWLIAILFLVSCGSNSNQKSNWAVELVADGFKFIEGPLWYGDRLLFSDIPAGKIYAFSEDSGVSVFIESSGNSNGLILDLEGNLILAQHGLRQVARMTEDSMATLVSYFRSKRLNSPNDMAISQKGTIYFTDPSYGINEDEEELGFYGVYQLIADGRLNLIDSSLQTPNGIVLSNEDSVLYVADTDSRIIFSWNLNDANFQSKKIFARIPSNTHLDGMTKDQLGKLYVTGTYGVHIFNPKGILLDSIAIDGHTTNCTWNADESALYVTSGPALYRAVRE
ncbi:MAG: SMP-30/gluconolactonase/LRE family protein [Cyclobacteriaceae bacterium]